MPVILFFTACSRFRNKEVDGKKDLRIVCLSKHLTEMVFALGKGHDIVAVDLSSRKYYFDESRPGNSQQ